MIQFASSLTRFEPRADTDAVAFTLIIWQQRKKPFIPPGLGSVAPKESSFWSQPGAPRAGPVLGALHGEPRLRPQPTRPRPHPRSGQPSSLGSRLALLAYWVVACLASSDTPVTWSQKKSPRPRISLVREAQPPCLPEVLASSHTSPSPLPGPLFAKGSHGGFGVLQSRWGGPEPMRPGCMGAPHHTRHGPHR